MFQSHRLRKLLLIAIFVALFVVIAIQFFLPTNKLDTAAMLAESRSLREQGQVPKAGMVLDQILQAEPDNAEARFERSKLWLRMGERENAISDLQNIRKSGLSVQLNKLCSDACYLEGTLHLELHRAHDAEKCFLEAWKRNTDSLQPLEHVLRLYTLQMRRKDVLNILDQIEKRRPLLLEEMVLRIDAGLPIIDEKDAIASLTQFVTGDRQDEWSWSALLRYYIVGERYDEAKELVLGIPSTIASKSHFIGLKAVGLLQTSLLDEATATLRIANSDSPPDYWWWLAAGNLAEAKKQYQIASDSYRQAVDLQPESGYAHYRLGIAHESNSASQLALPQLDAAASVDRLHQLTAVITRMVGMPKRELGNTMFRIASLCDELNQGEDAKRWRKLALQFDPENEFASKPVARASRPTPFAGSSFSRSPLLVQKEIQQWLAASVANANPTDATADSPPIHRLHMEDVHERVGLDFQYFNGNTGKKYLIEAMGGGISVLDFDGDGWPDCYFPQGSGIPSDPSDFGQIDQLYRNVNGEHFVNVTLSSGVLENGYSQGAASGDINNDGFADIVVANFGKNRLFMNQGDGTFRDATDQCGWTETEMSSSVALADFDNDGNLDLYVTNYVDSVRVCRDAKGNIATCNPTNFTGVQDRLFRNTGDGLFVDVTLGSGLEAIDAKGLGVVATDLDDDGLVDIYVANDTTPNQLFKNLGGLRFQDISFESGTALSPEGHAQAGMGISAADFNGDLKTDLLVTNFYNEPNNLYTNLGSMNFTDNAQAAGLSRPSKFMLGFGAQAADLDLDGNLDLIVANGHIDDVQWKGEPWRMPTQLFHNQGNGRFQEPSQSSGDYFQGKQLGRGVACLDWNRDGRRDFIVVHQDRQVALLENQTDTTYRSLSIRLIGMKSNRSATGARVVIEVGGNRRRMDLNGGDGFYCTNERTMSFGLGSNSKGKLQITWPSGVMQSISFDGESMLTVVEPENN
jgi:enediyne biosynthesis protein E4